jgi:hypothetical protein
MGKNKRGSGVKLFLVRGWRDPRRGRMEGEVLDEVKILAKAVENVPRYEESLLHMIDEGLETDDGTPFLGVNVVLSQREAKRLLMEIDKRVDDFISSMNDGFSEAEIHVLNGIRIKLMSEMEERSETAWRTSIRRSVQPPIKYLSF